MLQESSVRIREKPRPKTVLLGHSVALFLVIFAGVFLLHAPLLRLPYFWDEAGYYVPAARDILLTASLIPHTTLSNAHPPLVLAWVALWWKLFGYAPLVARSAMVVVALFSLLGLYRLAELVANFQVAIASTLCAALYPVFFAQSSLVQVDLAAAGLTFWGLSAYLADQRFATAIWFSLAALTKETAIIAPFALAGWETLGCLFSKPFFASGQTRIRNLWAHRPSAGHVLVLLSPLVPLGLWYAYHFFRTGYVFGNPEYFRYNVASTLNPLRFLFAFALRLWQVFGYLHLWLLTLAMLLAMLLPPLLDGKVERRRISLPTQIAFLIVTGAYVIVMALIGGAVLARYMLPVVPLVMIVAVSTICRRLPYWPAVIALILAAFVLGWFWNPPYGFSPEDNLAYRDYVVLHQNAERFLEARYPMAHVLTAWPASDELTRPWLGYLTRPMQVVRIEDFSLEQVLSAEDFRSHFDMALVFSTKYEPPATLLERWMSGWRRWQEIKTQFFGFHHDLPPAAIAQILGGKIVFVAESQGQWIAVIQVEKSEIQEARASASLTPAFSGTH